MIEFFKMVRRACYLFIQLYWFLNKICHLRKIFLLKVLIILAQSLEPGLKHCFRICYKGGHIHIVAQGTGNHPFGQLAKNNIQSKVIKFVSLWQRGGEKSKYIINFVQVTAPSENLSYNHFHFYKYMANKHMVIWSKTICS